MVDPLSSETVPVCGLCQHPLSEHTYGPVAIENGPICPTDQSRRAVGCAPNVAVSGGGSRCEILSMSNYPVTRSTIGGTRNSSVINAGRARNNGRYNGDGRHWGTPPEVFDPLHAEFDFTLDPCATSESAKCSRFYTEADDGLSKDWSCDRVFMNPPYGKEIYAWTRKAREEAKRGALVVGLLPASCDLKWWHDDVVGHAEVRYIRGRVRFLTGGLYRASGFFASVVVIWRPAGKSTKVSG